MSHKPKSLEEIRQADVARSRRAAINRATDESYQPWPPIDAVRQFDPDSPDVCYRFYVDPAMPIITPVIQIPGSRVIATPALWQNANPLAVAFGTVPCPLAIIWLNEVGAIDAMMPIFLERLTPGGFYVGPQSPTIIKAQFERLILQTHPAIPAGVTADILIQIKRRK